MSWDLHISQHEDSDTNKCSVSITRLCLGNVNISSEAGCIFPTWIARFIEILLIINSVIQALSTLRILTSLVHESLFYGTSKYTILLYM